MAINIPESKYKRIVIVGAGFAGMTLAQRLSGKKFQVVLIDKNNYHQFQPLLYQVAMSGLEPSSICFPLRKAFQHSKNVLIRVTEVLEIIPDQNRLMTPLGHVNYDILVLAYGTKTNYFGNNETEKESFPLKSVSQALFLRNQILADLEKALITRDFDRRQSLLHIVVVGGGPTGVELAGALAEMKTFILPKDYAELNNKEVEIYLVQGAEKLLPTMSTYASENATKALTKLGVRIKTSTHVVKVDSFGVYTDSGEIIRSAKVIWAAGVICPKLKGLPENVYGKGNRLLVDEQLKVQGYENIYALGDLSILVSAVYPQGHPQVAQVAIQQAKYLAKRFLGKRDRAFLYKDLGSMATIGRNKAVVELPGFKFKGFVAWFVWLFIHIRSLIGGRNKIVVMLNWLWNYLTYDQSLRLIIRPFRRESKT